MSKVILTLSGVTQLSAHHSSISTIPGVKTHGTPLIVHTDLDSAFIWNVTSCQSQLTSCTWSYRHKGVSHPDKWSSDCTLCRTCKPVSVAEAKIAPHMSSHPSGISLCFQCTALNLGGKHSELRYKNESFSFS